MAENIKCLIFFHDNGGTGWTETHYRSSSAGTPPLDTYLTHLADTVCPARAALLSGDCQIIGCRVSYERAGAVASANKRMFLSGPLDQAGVSPSLSLAIEFKDVSKTKSKITHLRGFWDAVELNGNYQPTAPDAAAAGWEGRLNDWKAALIQGGYGWLSGDPAKSAWGPVVSYLTNANGQINFTLGAAEGVMPSDDEAIPFRFARINDSNSPLNAELLCYVIDATHVVTAKQIAAGPYKAGGTFSYRGVTFVAYNQVYNVSLGRRQQGRPIGQLPGRSKARARY